MFSYLLPSLVCLTVMVTDVLCQSFYTDAGTKPYPDGKYHIREGKAFMHHLKHNYFGKHQHYMTNGVQAVRSGNSAGGLNYPDGEHDHSNAIVYTGKHLDTPDGVYSYPNNHPCSHAPSSFNPCSSIDDDGKYPMGITAEGRPLTISSHHIAGDLSDKAQGDLLKPYQKASNKHTSPDLAAHKIALEHQTAVGSYQGFRQGFIYGSHRGIGHQRGFRNGFVKGFEKAVRKNADRNLDGVMKDVRFSLPEAIRNHPNNGHTDNYGHKYPYPLHHRPSNPLDCILNACDNHPINHAGHSGQHKQDYNLGGEFGRRHAFRRGRKPVEPAKEDDFSLGIDKRRR